MLLEPGFSGVLQATKVNALRLVLANKAFNARARAAQPLPHEAFADRPRCGGAIERSLAAGARE